MNKDFNRRLTTIKGYYGEMLVKKRLRIDNWSVLSDDKPIKHSFDFLIQKDKYDIRMCEIKVSNELNGNLINSNGVNYNNHMEYIKLNNKINIPFMIIWVDTKLNEIYGGDFNKLLKIQNHNVFQFPKKLSGITGEKMLYSKINMEHYDFLSQEEIDKFNIIDRYKKKIIISDKEKDVLIKYLFNDDESYLNLLI